MSRRRSLPRHLLLLMLAAGPLQAQTVLLCDMMDVPGQETCCCGQPEAAAREAQAMEGCDRPPCPATSRGEADGCCDSVVEMAYETEADALPNKPPADRQSSDPPAPAVIAYVLPLPPGPAARAPAPAPVPVSIPDGSDLYLRTERLRI